MDEELILSTLAQRMGEVRWTYPGETEQSQFKKVSRKVQLWADVPAADWPCCMQAEWGDDVAQVSGMPYKMTLGVNWIIYQNYGKDKNKEGTVANNLILNGVRAALAPKPTDVGFPDKRTTLGNLVYHCFISGRIFKDPGDIDKQGMLVVPIKVLVP